MKIFTFAYIIFCLGLAIDYGCRPPTTGEQAAVIDVACTVLTAFAGSAEEEALCASAKDIVAIEADVRASRAESGPTVIRKTNPCQIVGTVCMNDAELARAIKTVRASK